MAGEALNDYSDLIARATDTTAELVNFFKSARVAGAAPGALVAGRWTSLWQYDGTPGAASASAPGANAVVDNATAGALGQVDPASGSTKKRLVSLVLGTLAVGTYVFADRLTQQGNLSGNVTTAQTVSSAALTRWSNGVGVETALEIYTQIGATTTTCKLASYTNTVGTTGRVGPNVVIGNTGFREAQRMIPLPIASGDKGIQAISTFQINTTATGTAGACGPTMFKRLATLPLSTIGSSEQWNCMLKSGGPLDLGTNADSCIFGMWFPNTTTAPEVYGQALFIEK